VLDNRNFIFHNVPFNILNCQNNWWLHFGNSVSCQTVMSCRCRVQQRRSGDIQLVWKLTVLSEKSEPLQIVSCCSETFTGDARVNSTEPVCVMCTVKTWKKASIEVKGGCSLWEFGTTDIMSVYVYVTPYIQNLSQNRHVTFEYIEVKPYWYMKFPW
jgi:hypothetical protein